MQVDLATGRLFWKLVLALWLSMVLSMAGVLAYLSATGHQPPPDGAMSTLGGLPIVPLISGAICTLIIGLGLAWYLSRPLRHLRWALRRLRDGYLDTRVQSLMGKRSDEIADLAQEFDSMASRLQQLTESRRVLLHDISHELRSPLTRLQAAIGLLRQDPSQTMNMADRIQRESERLDSLIEELLTLHRLEARPAGAALERVDVVELLHAIADDADFEARSSDRSVSIDAPQGFVADVDGELIYRAYENVIRNAVKFSPQGSRVEIRARLMDDNATLETCVQDRGPGVPPHMLGAIFEPFVRVNGALLPRGAGLGLAIARRVMETHGGSAAAALRDGGGLVVTLVLRKTQDR